MGIIRKSYVTKPDDQCDAEAECERTRAGGRGIDMAGRVEDLIFGIDNCVIKPHLSERGSFGGCGFLLKFYT